MSKPTTLPPVDPTLPPEQLEEALRARGEAAKRAYAAWQSEFSERRRRIAEAKAARSKSEL